MLIKSVVYISRQEYISCKKINTEKLSYIILRAKRIEKRLKADKINGNETTQDDKEYWSNYSVGYCLNLFLTSFVPDVSVKCFDINKPNTNAGKTPVSPIFAKNIKINSNRNIYFISGSITCSSISDCQKHDEKIFQQQHNETKIKRAV